MVRSLVLNASYEPLSVVSGRRAVVLVLRGRAVVIEARDELWHASATVVPVPSVVRLTSYVRVPFERTIPVTRRAVFGRDGQRCQYCGDPADSLDHVTPRSRGGTHTWDNVVACCRRCNLRKGDRMPGEIGLHLKRRPLAPNRFGWIYASSGYTVDPTWHPYLLAHTA
jgi:5-methylcytosine-specific restriction endonuclease McrA